GALATGIGENFYARCVKLARRENVLTIIDAKGPPLEQALREHPHVAKPNRAELAQTLGMKLVSDKALRDAMLRCISLGAQWIVVTDGPRDVLLGHGNDFWKISIPKIKTISPIGSGDAFAAGMAVGI